MYREVIDGIGIYLDENFIKRFDPARTRVVLSNTYHSAGLNVDAQLDSIFAGYSAGDKDCLTYFEMELTKLAQLVKREHPEAQSVKLPTSLEDLICKWPYDLLRCSNPCGCPIIWLPKGYPWEFTDYPKDMAQVNFWFFDALRVVFDVDEIAINDVLDLDIHEIE